MRFALELAGLLLSAIGAIVSGWALFTSEDPPLVVLACVLSVICLASLVLLLLSTRELHARDLVGKRAQAWAAAMPKVSQSVLDLANSVVTQDRPGDEGGKQDFQKHAKNACYSLAAAFSQVAGRDCRVTLVETWYPGGEAEGKRSGAAVKRLVTTGVTTSADKGTDWVGDNTDFDEIFKGEDFFFSNDLPSELEQGYKNSHWTRSRVQEMKRTGRYPYKATIVWPVQALVELDGEPAMHTVGFLCVDCKEPGVFDATLDPTVGELVARAFYSVWPRTALKISELTEGHAS